VIVDAEDFWYKQTLFRRAPTSRRTTRSWPRSSAVIPAGWFLRCPRAEEVNHAQASDHEDVDELRDPRHARAAAGQVVPPSSPQKIGK
jgi:hypothetical protein